MDGNCFVFLNPLKGSWGDCSGVLSSLYCTLYVRCLYRKTVCCLTQNEKIVFCFIFSMLCYQILLLKTWVFWALQHNEVRTEFYTVLSCKYQIVPSFSRFILVAYHVQEPRVGALWLTKLDEAVWLWLGTFYNYTVWLLDPTNETSSDLKTRGTVICVCFGKIIYTGFSVFLL